MGKILSKSDSSELHNDTVEDSTIQRRGKYTFGRLVVYEGESVSIFDSNGTQTAINGPCAIRPYFSKVEFLRRIACDQQSYLIITFLSGKIEHRRGPACLFIDPTIHSNIRVHNALLLEANEVLVVYAEETSALGIKGNKNVIRRLVKGPEIFIPQSNEWLHSFSWHGTVIPGKSKGSITGSPNDTKTAHAVEFSKLRVLPDQMYYTVRDLRTSDDALLNLHIMIFFELVDIEKMLDATNDPISDIVNAANADVMTFGASHTYETLLSESRGLSENSAYPLLVSRMETIGYKLNKVVYRGYQTSSALQAMQETAISSRTKLRLEADTQRQEQTNMANLLVSREAQAKHKFAQELNEVEHKIRLQKITTDQALQAQAAQNAVELTHAREMNNERKDFLKSLADMKVDLTQYLVAEVATKPTSHVLIENRGGNTNNKAPSLHIH